MSRTNASAPYFVGVLYAATGAKHRAEASASAVRCKVLMPEIPIAVWTDSELSDPVFDIVHVARSPSYDYMDKVTSLSETPFRRTLFLDTDTHVLDDISASFQLLDCFDIAAAHASNRTSTRSTYLISGVPDAFPEMNTGVLLYRQGDRTNAFLSDWRRLFDQDRNQFAQDKAKRAADLVALKPPGDQSSFRHALFRSELRIATLPPEYNFRFGYSAFAGSAVKIFHGRHPDFARLAAEVNAEPKRRVYVPGLGVLRAAPDHLPEDG